MPSRRLFICGCPRSGTTAMWDLLAHDPRMVIGLERYFHAVSRPDMLDDALFTKERFFSLEAGDTFYEGLETFDAYYTAARERFDAAAYVGDKIPYLYKRFEEICERFPDVRIIMMFRNPFDVAASYQERADNPKDEVWPAIQDATFAIQDWNEALDCFARYQDRLPILPVDYEEFFFGRHGIESLYAFLELEVTDSVLQEFNHTAEVAEQIIPNRRNHLTPIASRNVALLADFERYRQVVKP